MPPPYDNRGSSRAQRGLWGHWVPLAVTVTVATVGLAAWAWSQRRDEQEEAAGFAENDADLDYNRGDYEGNAAYGAYRDDHYDEQYEHQQSRQQHLPPTQRGLGSGLDTGRDMAGEGEGWTTRMNTQQFLDSTGKTIATGIAAASAAVGKALASIREEDRSYTEEDTSSEEGEAKKGGPAPGPVPVPGPASASAPAPVSAPAPALASAPGPSEIRRRKTIAIVVSADARVADVDDGGFNEHASILSHIPRYNDLSMLKIFVLIYAPGLKEPPNEIPTSHRPPPSETSSFSNIGHDQAHTPGEKSPILGVSSESTFYNAVYSEALSLVSKETMILPFTTPNGYAYILRHLQPEILYLQESLAGDNGSVITNLHTWFRHDVVLVVGAESGHGGLADSESEAERADKSGRLAKWWQKPERVGRGRGVVVLDSIRVHEDWAHRVQDRE